MCMHGYKKECVLLGTCVNEEHVCVIKCEQMHVVVVVILEENGLKWPPLSRSLVRLCTWISFKDEKHTLLVASLGITPECTLAMPAQCVCVLL